MLPYSNQQLAWTYGGPIIRDKFHVFGSMRAGASRPPSPTRRSTRRSTSISRARAPKEALARLDYQVSPRNRLTFRRQQVAGHYLPIDDRFSGGANRTPSSVIQTNRRSLNIQGTVTRVLNNSTVNGNPRRLRRVWFSGSTRASTGQNHPNAPGREMERLADSEHDRRLSHRPGAREFAGGCVSKAMLVPGRPDAVVYARGRHDLRLASRYILHEPDGDGV